MDKPIVGYGWYIRLIDNALEKEANSNLQALNLTMQQNRALAHLAHTPGHTLPLKTLEERFGAAQSTVAGLVSRLERKGLVEALSNPADKRIKLVKLTEEGLRLHAISHQQIIESEERLTSRLTPQEQEMLLSCLQKVHEALR